MATSEKTISSVKAKLDALTNQVNKRSLIWRPTRGQEMAVRIIPYRHGPDPFNELYFHYDIGSVKTILCSNSNNYPDKQECSICEYAKFLLKERNDKNYALYKRLKSRLRVYVPVLVRGEEDAGIKFWGIGKSTYTTIANFFIAPDYGDLSDPLRGRDIKVKAIEPSPQYIYGQVNIMPAANPSKLCINNELAMSLIKECPNVFDAFDKMNHDEIKAALEQFIAGADDQQELKNNGTEILTATTEQTSDDGTNSIDALMDELIGKN